MSIYVILGWPNWLVFLLCVALAFVPSMALVYLVGFSKVSKAFDRFEGVSPPTIGAVALLFGLFAAFLANDIWSKYQLSGASVAHEADAVRNIARLAEGRPEVETAKLKELLGAYLKDVIEKDWSEMKGGKRSKEILARVRDISNEIIAGSMATQVSPAVQSKILDSFTAMREHRQTRVNIAESRRFSAKWYGLIFFGLLTQIMIVAIHLKKPWAMFLAQAIFSSAFAACLSILVLHDFPFSEMNPISAEPLVKALESLSR